MSRAIVRMSPAAIRGYVADADADADADLRELWVRAWLETIRAGGDGEQATANADRCVDEYRRRYES